MITFVSVKRPLAISAILLGGILLLLVGVTYVAPGFTFGLIQNFERFAAGLDKESVSVGRMEISYLKGGSGETLLMLHGFGGNKDHWVRTSRHLVKHFHLVIPDLPGFGESSRANRKVYSIRHQADRIVTFLDALEIESCHIAGNSMGGAIAGEIAKRFPERVKSLWLIAPAGVLSAEIPEIVDYFERGINPMLVENSDQLQRLLELIFVKIPYIPFFIRNHMTAQAISHRSFLDKVFGDLISHGFSLERALKGSNIPTLVLWGEKDKILDVSGAQILGKLIPNSQVALLPETGHIPMLERPELAAHYWLDFYRTLYEK